MKRNKKNKKIISSIPKEKELEIKEWYHKEFLENYTEYLHPMFLENIQNLIRFGKRKPLDVQINYILPTEFVVENNIHWNTLYETCKNFIPNHLYHPSKLGFAIQQNWEHIQNDIEGFLYEPRFWGTKHQNENAHLTALDEEYSISALRKLKVGYLFHHYKMHKETLSWVYPFEYKENSVYKNLPDLSSKEFVNKEKIQSFISKIDIKPNIFYEYFYFLLNGTLISKFLPFEEKELIKTLVLQPSIYKETELKSISAIYRFHDEFVQKVKEYQHEPKCFKSIEEQQMYYVEKQFVASLLNQDVDLTGKHYVLHAGPTNAGKSYNALQSYYRAKNACYLAPLRLLAYEIYDSLKNHQLKGSLLTGESKIIDDGGTHIAATVEMYQSLHQERMDVLVIDECQMITDSQRGHGWLHAIVEANANEIHLISSIAAIPILKEYIERHNGTIEIKEYQRLIPLEVMEEDITIYDLEKNDAIIAFSKNRILELVAEIQTKTDYKVSYLYGMMPPEIKMKQMNNFREGITDIIVTTDVIAMGLNLPIRRVVFSETSKYNGESIEVLQRPLYEQIAGRAGRYGLFDIGYVTFSFNANRNDVIKKRVEPQRFECVTKQPTFEEFLDYLENTDTDKTLLDFLILWQDTVEYDKAIYKKANIKEIIKVLESINYSYLKELKPKEQFFFAFLPYHQNRFTKYIANNIVDYYLYRNHYSENQTKSLLQECMLVHTYSKDIILESQYQHLQTLSQYAYHTENEILIGFVQEEKNRIIREWDKILEKVIARKRYN